MLQIHQIIVVFYKAVKYNIFLLSLNLGEKYSQKVDLNLEKCFEFCLVFQLEKSKNI